MTNVEQYLVPTVSSSSSLAGDSLIRQSSMETSMENMKIDLNFGDDNNDDDNSNNNRIKKHKDSTTGMKMIQFWKYVILGMVRPAQHS